MSTVLVKWKYKYTCDECILKTKTITKQELKEIKNNYLTSKGNRYYLDTSWLDNEGIKETIKFFLDFEKEDSEYVRNENLWQMHYFVEGLSRGVIIFSEQEFNDYVSFYGNNPEVVVLLRRLLFENPKNNFYKTTYIHARTKKLSASQIAALKRTKAFKCISEDYSEFWDNLPSILAYILSSGVETPEFEKVKNIITNILENEFFTKDQKKVIDNFVRKYLN